MHRTLAIGLSLFLASPALAQERSPDDLIARGHFTRGADAYGEGRYADALAEFEAAHAAEPLPEFDYNIARCQDRLGQRAGALAAYERYVTVSPTAPNLDEVRDRIVRLKHELAERATRDTDVAGVAPAVAGDATSHRASARKWVAPGTVGGGAVLLGVVGAGLLGSAAGSFNHLINTCAPSCAPSAFGTIEARQRAGEALLGLGAVTAVVDVALIIRAARRK